MEEILRQGNQSSEEGKELATIDMAQAILTPENLGKIRERLTKGGGVTLKTGSVSFGKDNAFKTDPDKVSLSIGADNKIYFMLMKGSGLVGRSSGRSTFGTLPNNLETCNSDDILTSFNELAKPREALQNLLKWADEG